MGRPSTYRSNAFSGKVFLQGKRTRASNARPYKSFFDSLDFVFIVRRAAAVCNVE